jgi:ABC-type transport system substrate-binding protein
VKWKSRSVAGLAVIVCFAAMMGACASRTRPPVVSVPQPAPQSPEPPVAPAPAPEPSPAPPPVALPEAVSRPCALIGEPGEPITTVALTERINPLNAPRPSNDGERLLFRQLYETLVRVDCEGHVIPALASSCAAAWTGAPGS